MSPRTGRPKSDNPKTNDIKVRVDDETLKALNDYCYNNNQTRAEVIRKAIIQFLGKKKNRALLTLRKLSTLCHIERLIYYSIIINNL